MRTGNRCLAVVLLFTSAHLNALWAQDDEATDDGKEPGGTSTTVDAADLGTEITVAGPLGVPLGQVLTVVGQVDDTIAESKTQLKIEFVNGRPLKEPVTVRYEWAGDADESALPNRQSVRLRGYQGGQFRRSQLPDDDQQTFRFEVSFVIASRLDEAGPEQKAQLEEQIADLALDEDDIFIEGSSRFVKKEGVLRIRKAAAKLVEAGRTAWPILVKHFRDKTPSMASRPTTGGHTVGIMCQEIVRKQVQLMPKGYPGSRTRTGKDGKARLSPGMYWALKPTLEEWLAAREEKSLREIQAEALRQLIVVEDEIGYADDETKAEINGPLTALLKRLQP